MKYNDVERYNCICRRYVNYIWQIITQIKLQLYFHFAQVERKDLLRSKIWLYITADFPHQSFNQINWLADSSLKLFALIKLIVAFGIQWN